MCLIKKEVGKALIEGIRYTDKTGQGHYTTERMMLYTTWPPRPPILNKCLSTTLNFNSKNLEILKHM